MSREQGMDSIIRELAIQAMDLGMRDNPLAVEMIVAQLVEEAQPRDLMQTLISWIDAAAGCLGVPPEGHPDAEVRQVGPGEHTPTSVMATHMITARIRRDQTAFTHLFLAGLMRSTLELRIEIVHNLLYLLCDTMKRHGVQAPPQNLTPVPSTGNWPDINKLLPGHVIAAYREKTAPIRANWRWN